MMLTMSKNTMYALVALLLVVVIGSAGGYWAIKKIRTKQNQEFRYEGTVTLVQEGADPVVFKQAVLSGSVMDEVIEKHDLLARWEMTDPAAAKARIEDKFAVQIQGLKVTISYQDKDKLLAKDILETLMQMFSAKQNAARGL